MILCPDEDQLLQFVTSDEHFVAFAAYVGVDIGADSTPDTQCLVGKTALAERGYCVWSASEAIQEITNNPDSDITAKLVPFLEYWYVIKKLLVD